MWFFIEIEAINTIISNCFYFYEVNKSLAL